MDVGKDTPTALPVPGLSAHLRSLLRLPGDSNRRGVPSALPAALHVAPHLTAVCIRPPLSKSPMAHHINGERVGGIPGSVPTHPLLTLGFPFSTVGGGGGLDEKVCAVLIFYHSKYEKGL